MVVGDFNETLLPSDQNRGVFAMNRADKLAAMVDECNLMDIHPSGYRYTWVRKREGEPLLLKKLDWCFVDIAWRNMFTEGGASVLARRYSDHHPLLARCALLPRGRGPRPFRFEAAWMSHPSYEAVVAAAWNQLGSVHYNLEQVREQSLVFNKDIFGNIFDRKQRLERRLSGVQRALERVDSASLLRTMMQIQQELEETLKQEELLWYQKSREQVIKYGDRNTRFFHTQTIIRRKRSKVYALTLPCGEWCEDEEVLKREVLCFFKSLFCPP